MQETVRIALRMRDVGLALRTSGKHGVRLNRIALQKMLYLADAVSLLFELLPPLEGHETYKHGPYDRQIQNAIDSLCFRGFGRIARAVQIDNKLSTEYELTIAGERWANRLSDDPNMTARSRLLETLGAEIDKTHSWQNLRELVYAEPTFVAVRPSGWGQKLPLGDVSKPSASALFQLSRIALEHSAQRPPSRELLISIFFRYLNQYATLQNRR